jgi:hypothetical protein
MLHPSPVLDVVGRGGGEPLDKGTRAEMEAGLGHDFGGVRVHTGPAAAASAKAVQAHAYTVGDEIVFDSGRYAPSTSEGRHRLAHELTHVVQQRSGPVEGTDAGNGVAISNPSDRFEQAAEASARQVSSGLQAEGGAPTVQTGSPSVQRQAAEEEEKPPEEPT